VDIHRVSKTNPSADGYNSVKHFPILSLMLNLFTIKW